MNQPLAKKLFDYEPTDTFVDFQCGNSKFSDDVWDFNGYVETEHKAGARVMLTFTSFASKPLMKDTIKWFMHHEMITGSFSTARRTHDGIVRFMKFVDKFYPQIECFSQIHSVVVEQYFRFLTQDARKEVKGKPESEWKDKLSAVTIKKAALALRQILKVGSVREWFPDNDIRFLEKLYQDMIIKNKNLKEDKQKQSDKMDAKINDKELVDRILECAIDDLEKKESVISASAILITTQLGLRISELVAMLDASVDVYDGKTQLRYFTQKLHAERVPVYKPANELVEIAVEAMIEYTAPLRKKWDGQPFLFLSKANQGITQVSYSNFAKNYLKPWFKKHDFKYEDGKKVEFTAHTFRHICATYSIRNGARLETVSKLLNHRSIRGTLHYTHITMEDVKENFTKIFNENAVISGKRVMTIKEYLAKHKPFAGMTAESADKKRKAMNIQILTHGFCLHHPMRDRIPCAGDGVCMSCTNFVTTPEFAHVHESRLAKVREELNTNIEEGPFQAKLRTQEAYLVGILEDFERQGSSSGKSDNAEYTKELKSLAPEEEETEGES